jgi:AmiR/NasT family two-component response regulator
MTAFPDPSVGSLARNLGAVAVLKKPIDEEELRAAIASALGESRRGASRGG